MKKLILILGAALTSSCSQFQVRLPDGSTASATFGIYKAATIEEGGRWGYFVEQSPLVAEEK